MESDIFDFVAIFNEAILLLLSYLLFLYTEYVPSPEMRYMFGNIFLYLLYINFSVNLLLLCLEILRQIKRSYLRWKSHREQRKARNMKHEEKNKIFDKLVAEAEIRRNEQVKDMEN